MQRLSSSLFMLSLLLYYVPKLLRFKKPLLVKAHIAVGTVSIVAMLVAFVQTFGTEDFIKYIGFSVIMLAIGATGYMTMKKGEKGRILHIVSTIGFFAYLFISIKLF